MKGRDPSWDGGLESQHGAWERPATAAAGGRFGIPETCTEMSPCPGPAPADPKLRAERIRLLRRAVRRGFYEVDDAALAVRLLAERLCG